MEEDIKVLEEMIRVYKQDESNIDYSNYYICKCKTERQAIENLIKGYKELKEKNKKQGEHINNINKRNSNQRTQLKLLQQHRLKKYIMSNYIEKSKVRDLIQDIDETIYITNDDEVKFYMLGFKNSIKKLLQEEDKVEQPEDNMFICTKNEGCKLE